MPATTTSQPDGQGGTWIGTVTRDATGRVTSIDTRHLDAAGNEIESEVESRTYADSGQMRERLRRKRQRGRLSTENETFDERGQRDSATVRELIDGKVTRWSHTVYRDGEPATSIQEEYEPPGTKRRTRREVYGPNGVVRESTIVEYDAKGRETARRVERYDESGRLTSRDVSRLHLKERLFVTEVRTLGSLWTAVEVLDGKGQTVSVTESHYDANGTLRSKAYTTIDRAGNARRSVAVAFSDAGDMVTLEDGPHVEQGRHDGPDILTRPLALGERLATH